VNEAGAMLKRTSAVRPGQFPLGSPASRAAARALLKAREEAANQEVDVRIVFDLAIQESAGGVLRSIDAQGKVTELIFPAHGECLGVFEVPPGTTVEEALRRAKARGHNSGFVIDLEPGRGRVFAQKPSQPKILGS
jgi:phosphatidylserine/phosphatidylglycerophosphate/cardiolipin synthase-like enzyme